MKWGPKLRFMPEGREGAGILPGIIAVMVYLCVMAIAVGLSAHNAAAGWSADLNSTATLQVVNPDRETRRTQALKALELLNATPGIESAELLSDRQIAGLLEPWLGTGNVSEDLPVPALIAITLSPGARIDLKALASQIRAVAPDARLDDQQGWITDLANLTRTVQIAAIAAVLMISGSTIAIVIFATRAKLETHREHVEIVHLMGAEDRLVSGELRHRFLLYGLEGGSIGFILGAITLGAIYYYGQQMGGGLVPQLSLSTSQLVALCTVPLLATILTTYTAGAATRRSLARML